MNKSMVAIVGRPNVGKSRLFNRLAGNRISIVEGEPGITRDRVYADISWQGQSFVLIDTGGLEVGSEHPIKSKVEYQARMAMEEAELILFVVDGKTGMTAVDKEIADILRQTKKDVILIVNKIDNFSNKEEKIWEFYNLGFEIIIPISAEHGKNIGDLLEEIKNIVPSKKISKDSEEIDVAVIGKPNVGKSSLINYLAGYERTIVSEIPGTTRDAVNTPIIWNNVHYNFIDTAGLRKKSRVNESVEYYSVLRAIRAVDNSDVSLMMIDAAKGVTKQDKKIAGYAHDNGKAIMIAVNKWDLMKKKDNTMANYQDEIYYQMKFLNYAPITFISVINGERIEEVMKLLEYVVDQSSMRIKTGLLNEVIEEAQQLREPPGKRGKRLKIFYVTQTGVKPPSFVFFVNNPELMHFSYKRYIENALRESFGFIGSPIKIKLKKKK